VLLFNHRYAKWVWLEPYVKHLKIALEGRDVHEEVSLEEFKMWFRNPVATSSAPRAILQDKDIHEAYHYIAEDSTTGTVTVLEIQDFLKAQSQSVGDQYIRSQLDKKEKNQNVEKVRGWSPRKVSKWVATLRNRRTTTGVFKDVAKSFRKARIGGTALLNLNDADLIELGVAVIPDRKFLLYKISKLKDKEISYNKWIVGESKKADQNGPSRACGGANQGVNAPTK